MIPKKSHAEFTKDLDAVYSKKCCNQFKSKLKTENIKSTVNTKWDKVIKKCSNCGANCSRRKEQCPFCRKG